MAGGGEDVVSAERVVAEQLRTGGKPGRRHRRQVDHGVDAVVTLVHLVQDLHGLAHVGEVGPDERARVVLGPDKVDIGHRVAVIEKVAQNWSAELAATPG